MTDELVRLAVAGGVATITLDSPHNRNALSSALVGQLGAALDAGCADPAVRAIVLTHTGTVFCAGADLTEAAGGGAVDGARRLAELLRALLAAPKPVIAVLNGHVRAGGMGLVGACDLALAGPQATFAFTEARLGLAAAVISLTTLPRMSPRAAARHHLTGATFSSAQAADCGLVSWAGDQPAEELATLLDDIGRCSPQGLAETKRLLAAPLLARFDERAAELVATSARLFGSDEALEGMTAFLQRRTPSWVP